MDNLWRQWELTLAESSQEIMLKGRPFRNKVRLKMVASKHNHLMLRGKRILCARKIAFGENGTRIQSIFGIGK